MSALRRLSHADDTRPPFTGHHRSKPGMVVGKRWLAMCGWEISAGAKADTAALQTGGGRASVNSFLRQCSPSYGLLLVVSMVDRAKSCG